MRHDPTVYFSITSTPSGAAVIIDGAEVGNTPLITNASCREPITVEVTADGYLSYRTEVACERGVTVDLSPSLTRAPRR